MKETAFVSYSHKDRYFVERLVSNLSPYSDVFWDINLTAGHWKKQLQQQIESRKFFLIVMSPEQQVSIPCQDELQIAQGLKADSEIIPIRIHMPHKDVDLEKLQYADFTRSFDEGFRQLTFLMLNESGMCQGFETTSGKTLRKIRS